MQDKIKKVIETENFVDQFISKHGFAPTYRRIEQHFNISKCAAWNRCEKFRHKMKNKKYSTIKRMGFIDQQNFKIKELEYRIERLESKIDDVLPDLN